MFQILEARFLAPDVKLLRIEAPRIARKRQAGQFVILRVHERGERIPITIADSNAERGDITIVVQGIGKTHEAPQLPRRRRVRSATWSVPSGSPPRSSTSAPPA